MFINNNMATVSPIRSQNATRLIFVYKSDVIGVEVYWYTVTVGYFDIPTVEKSRCYTAAGYQTVLPERDGFLSQLPPLFSVQLFHFSLIFLMSSASALSLVLFKYLLSG